MGVSAAGKGRYIMKNGENIVAKELVCAAGAGVLASTQAWSWY
jgi:hypothetical protein